MTSVAANREIAEPQLQRPTKSDDLPAADDGAESQKLKSAALGTIEPPSAVEADASESFNVWPDDAAEAAFLSETKEGRATPAPKPEQSKDEEASNPLPKLDELVSRIPAGTRELLDELFRAKFTTVRRVKASDLKP